MKNDGKNPAKELYQQLRQRSCAELWEDEVPRFNRADQRERFAKVGLVRAVGVVFSEHGTEAQKSAAREWLRGLLKDPQEKIRRYAMTALPKLGAGSGEEAALLQLLKKAESERERKFLGQTLEKIGGHATLQAGALDVRTEQKVKASVARAQASTVRLDRALSEFAGLRIHLRGRRGLEQFVRTELEENPQTRKKFHVAEVSDGLVALTAHVPFSLGDLYALRSFGTVGLVPGIAKHARALDSEAAQAKFLDGLAALITSPLARRILETFTVGPIRYRLDFVSKGHQRGAIRQLAARVYTRSPALLNDAREAPWSIEIHPAPGGSAVELTPRLVPDPRFAYRQQDVPAASHPPLAACLARLAGPGPKDGPEIIWDPFCGSGLELIERTLVGGVKRVFGTDLSAAALESTRRNFAAAPLPPVATHFHVSDLRDFERIKGLGPETVTLLITNPPMGKRVPIPNLRGLIEDLFEIAAIVLKPGGRLVFANPLRLESPERSLKLQLRQVVDFGGFDCRLELYRKTGR
jgi:precorrin-6B methylase 2